MAEVGRGAAVTRVMEGHEPVNAVAVISAIGAIGAVIAHLLIAVWYYGRLTQKVEGHEARICTHDAQLLDHEQRISRLEGGK